jgi:hypothetical protein
MSEHEHHGYRLSVETFGSGWRVRIYGPGDNAPMLQMPATDERDGRHHVIGEAREIVDRNIQDIRAMSGEPATKRHWWRTVGARASH